MTFGEKLFKLRKERGLSQETLAEQLGTTRQAVSKWENHQGYPETEKLLLLASIFDVSADFLLREEAASENTDGHRYYVSREMAQGYLENQKTVNLCIGIGFMFWALSGIPFVLFSEGMAWRFWGMAGCFAAGIAAFVTGAVLERKEYKILREEPLGFDQGYLKALSDELCARKRTWHAFFMPCTVLFILGIITVSLTAGGVFAWSKYHGFVFLGLAAGLFGFCYCAGMMEAYELLVENEEYTKRLVFRVKRKVREWE